ncbi:unnamed protein product [Parnassius mnemosyne]|uniref:Uncharacterized protein n=1 Tax=Parnassius mnemosyne TaxID=213953 RepID=A0AAV1LKI7_9NEOP
MEQKIKLRIVSKSADILVSMLFASTGNKKTETEGYKIVKATYNDIYVYIYTLDKSIQELILNSEKWKEEDLETELEDAGRYDTRWALLKQKITQQYYALASKKGNSSCPR